MVEKLAVIVPTFNRASELHGCLQSIPEGLEEVLEIIVVDDCSTDDTKSLLNRLQKERKNLQCITLGKNKGVSHARNYALKHTSASYVTFLDSDDKLIGENFIHLLGLLDNSDADFIVANFKTSQSQKNIEDYCQFDISSKLKKIDVFNLVEAYLVSPRGLSIMTYCWSKVFRRTFLSKNGIEFNEAWSIYEDLDFVSKVLVFNPISYSYGKPIYEHVLSVGGLSGQISTCPCNYLSIIKRYGDFIKKPEIANIALKKAILKLIFEESKKNSIKSLYNLIFQFYGDISNITVEIPSNTIIKKLVSYNVNRLVPIFIILIFIIVKLDR